MTRYEAVFQALPGPTLIFDRAGHLETANPAALALLWARPTIGLGLELQSVPELIDEVSDFGRTEEPERRRKLELLTRSGPRSLDVIMCRVDEADPDGGILVAIDAAGSEGRSVRAGEGGRFAPIASLARMGHRVRTSMNGVLGMTCLLADTGLTTEQRDLVESIKTSAESLVALLDDWLDIARLESGMFDVEARSFSLREAIEEAMTEARARTADSGVRIQWEISPTTPDGLKGDARRFRQALINLVSSMVEETPGALIRVAIGNFSGQEAGSVMLHGTVAGPGTEPNETETSVLSTLVASTRLAAWLSRKLIDRMGGSVWVEVSPSGTPVCHFRLGFPVDEPRADSVAPAQRTPLRVLVAEDNAINRKVVCMLLERWGHHARAVRDGLEAVEAFEPSRYDLVLMDLQMPRMDGLAATRAIREKEAADGHHVPIHALTAHSLLDRDPSHCFDAGMDGYLVKPIRADELLKLVDNVSTGERVEDVVYDPGPVVVQSSFDYEEALDRLDGEEDLLLEVAAVFLDDCPTTMDEIREALARHDADAVAMTAHRLKGALGTLAAHAAHETATRLEKAARDHDFGSVGHAWKELQQHVAELLPALRVHVKN